MANGSRYGDDFEPEHQFEPLARSQCLGHLREGVIGRVAWTTERGPQILPVTYVLRADSVVFRTTTTGPLAVLAEEQPVAFEVDDFDVSRRQAWSVCVAGRSRRADLDGDQAGGADELPVPWVPGDRDLHIAVSLDEVTGRLITRR